MFAIFDTLMHEETRHIVFFVNWMAWEQARRGRARRGCARRSRLRYYCRAIGRLLGTVRRGQAANGGKDFSATQASVFLDGFTLRGLVEECCAEHAPAHGGFRPRPAAAALFAAVRGLGAGRPAPWRPAPRLALAAHEAFAVLAAAVGLALVAALVVHFGAGAVIRSLLAVGWAGFAAICLIQLALIGVMGIAWWVLLPGTSPWAAIWARLVRDSGSEVLPLSQVGGYVLGRAGDRHRRGFGQRRRRQHDRRCHPRIFRADRLHRARRWRGCCIRRTAGAGCGAGRDRPRRRGMFGRRVRGRRSGAASALLDRFAGALGRGWAERTAAGAAALHAAIADIYRRAAALWVSLALHLACWIASAVEIWLALRFMGAALVLARCW